MEFGSLLLGALLGAAAIVVLLNWLFARWLHDWRFFAFGMFVLALAISRIAFESDESSGWTFARDLIVLAAVLMVNVSMSVRTRIAHNADVAKRAGQLEEVRSTVNTLELEERARVRELSRANVVLQREIDQHALMESELRQALGRQRKIRAEQRDVVAIVSHQFRTPLAVIDAAAQSMESLVKQGQEPGYELKLRRIEKIHRACRRLSTLLDNCLTEDRMDAGLLLGQLKPVDLHQLIYRVIAKASENGVSRIQFDPEEAHTVIECDESALELMLSNLIQNALAYSKSDTPIAIDLSSTDTSADHTVRIAIRDHGVGIAPDAQPHVFDKYFRGVSSQSAGAGLGLYISREIARAHGGDLVIERSDDAGSVFAASLPFANSDRRSFD